MAIHSVIVVTQETGLVEEGRQMGREKRNLSRRAVDSVRESN